LHIARLVRLNFGELMQAIAVPNPHIRTFVDNEQARDARSGSEYSENVRAILESRLDRLGESVEQHLESDVMAIVGPIYPGLETDVRTAIEARMKSRELLRSSLAVVLQTEGGVIEAVERMAHVIRHHYDDVTVIVPDYAMSAGTVFAMSADRIMMSDYSCLGPIDPQIQRGDRLVPALSYLVQFERLKECAREGSLTGVDFAMLAGLDLAELHAFEKARELSKTLLRTWLANYKFRGWIRTEARDIPVTPEMRKARALEVAHKLMDHEHWCSHGRPISMEVLRRDLKLQIEDLEERPELSHAVRRYFHLIGDLMSCERIDVLVHAPGVCIR
jgi:hypothetical protein